MAPRNLCLTLSTATPWGIPLCFSSILPKALRAIGKDCPKCAPVGKTTRSLYKPLEKNIEQIEACMFQYNPPCRHTWAEVAPATSATFGLLSSRSKSSQPSPATKSTPPARTNIHITFSPCFFSHWLIDKQVGKEYNMLTVNDMYI